MKIRHSFVSNSSSSSYVIAYEPGTFDKERKCPHCGHPVGGGHNLLQMRENTQYSHSDSSGRHGTGEDYLKDLEKDYETSLRRIEETKRLQPDERASNPWSNRPSRLTNAERLADYVRWAASDKAEIDRFKEALKDKESAYIRIEYSDEILHTELMRLKDQGIVEIVNGE